MPTQSLLFNVKLTYKILPNTKLLDLKPALRSKPALSRVLFISINGKSILPQSQAPKPQGYPQLLCFSHSP